MAKQLRFLQAAFALLLVSSWAMGQTPYPDVVVQGQSWTSGVHHVQVPEKVFSPGEAGQAMYMGGTADAELVSGDQVRLMPGFHAGAFSGNGRFHAYINPALGPPGNLVALAPDPSTALVDGVLQVPKWEKFEIGLKLPPEYQDAIDRFFTHYYSDPNNSYLPTPGNVDPAHDLNPYADDSLQLVMTLTRPDGTQTLKWGFFMREAKWQGTSNTSLPVEDPGHPLYPYHIRFRMAPDQEGPWTFSLSVKAPYTATTGGTPLGEVLWSGYGFHCDPPLPDNHGPLRVNQANRRTLRFEDGTPFFGLGTNVEATGYGTWWSNPNSYRLVRRNFLDVTTAMKQLHSVGANFCRMFMMNKSLAPENSSLGVYDKFNDPVDCARNVEEKGSGQRNSWVMDMLADTARKYGIQIQLCILPYPPGIGYEAWAWLNDPYLHRFVAPRNPANGLYDMKRYFYSNGDPVTAGDSASAFYYWKRKYKYIMNRWGYAAHIPIIEPFNEIDQMLTYRALDMTDPDYANNCAENNLNWPTDTVLPGIISQWVTDIAQYVRGEVDLSNPANSPLGFDKKLFLMSYAVSDPNMPGASNYYAPFLNPEVDLIDAHAGMWPHVDSVRNHPDAYIHSANRDARNFMDGFLPQGIRKPFNQGEHNYYTYVQGIPDWGDEIEKIFHNYDASFHNEIWASVFSGKFAAGCTWEKERVFWWNPKNPPPDPNNGYQPPTGPFTPQFSNALNAVNILSVDGNPVPITNRPLHHHFGPLVDFLTQTGALNPDGLFDTDFTAHLAFDETDADELEAYYLVAEDKAKSLGWVHNRNAWGANNYYATASIQNFLGCTEPAGAVIGLDGFEPHADYTILWAPTRLNTTVAPASMDATADANGVITLNLAGEFGGIASGYMDTVRADYAFVAFVAPQLRMQPIEDAAASPLPKGSLMVYPNPAWKEAMVVLPSDGPWDLALMDVTGRKMILVEQVTGPQAVLNVAGLARGTYILQAQQADRREHTKLILR